MTALPLAPRPRPRLLSVAEFAALPESSDARYELQEGIVVMSPSPIPEHQICQSNLEYQLRRHLPRSLVVVAAVDIDLQLVPPGQPGFSRIPDLVVLPRTAIKRRRTEGGILRADDVVLVIEIISPGTRRMDTVIKHGEYADAGIPHYWIVDIDPPISLVACHQAGELGYADASPATGTFTTQVPFPVQIDLDALV